MNGSSVTPRYLQFQPSAALRDIVEVIWVQECGATSSAAPSTIIPSGRVELVFHYGDLFVQPQSDKAGPMARCHVVGQQKRPLVVQATGRTGIVIVRFRPWGAFRLMGEGLRDINHRVVDLELIWNRADLDRLLDSLFHAPTMQHRARIVDTFVKSRLIDDEIDRLSIESIHTLNRAWGREPVECVARRFELGRRQFNRRFTRGIGASPKQLSQVLRAQKAMACLRAGFDAHEVVDRCGFADQSHLIRDVVNHSTRRPGEWTRPGESNASRFFNSSELSAFCGITYL